MIHATADFELVNNTKIHPEAIAEGVTALKKGTPIITDTKMVKAGISLNNLRKYKIKILCTISQPDVIRKAQLTGKTRASIAMQKMSPYIDGSIIVIGNAPTALFEVLKLIEEESRKPWLIIGVPVGLVGARESKEMLMKTSIPYITVEGEKGGSTLAVSIINGLIILASEDG